MAMVSRNRSLDWRKILFESQMSLRTSHRARDNILLRSIFAVFFSSMSRNMSSMSNYRMTGHKLGMVYRMRRLSGMMHRMRRLSRMLHWVTTLHWMGAMLNRSTMNYMRMRDWANMIVRMWDSSRILYGSMRSWRSLSLSSSIGRMSWMMNVSRVNWAV